MTPTLPIDRRYRGVGRIKRRSGTTDPGTLQKLLSMLSELESAGRQDLLLGLKRGQLEPLELWTAYRARGLRGLPSIEHCKPLQEAVKGWIRQASITAKTARDYRYAFDALMACVPADATVADLPLALTRYRERARPRMFNLARAAARSFAGRFSDLWVALSKVGPKPQRVTKGTPQTPEEARAVAAKLGRLGGMWWTMCCTGMSCGPAPNGEYFSDRWDVLDDRIAIHGTKREGRDRVVPRLTTPIRAMLLYPAYRRHLVELGLKPNDARKTFARWMEEAGIPRVRRRSYLGHGRRDVTDVYEDYPVERYLKDDAERLKAFIGRDWAVKLEVVG